jgi:flagellar basal-body rod protein FlgG
MMRSLWTAASGMIAQQLQVDNISNNLANINTTGYKKERIEFKTLLYETMKRADLDPANRTGSPVNLQVGHGVRPIAMTRIFAMGNLQRTDNAQDFAIEGRGFFTVSLGDDVVKYTKDGAFKLSPMQDGNMLVTSEGYPILSADDEPIIFPPDVQMSTVTVDERGNFYYVDAEQTMQSMGFQIKLVQFANEQGLEGIGRNLLTETPASGPPLSEPDGDVVEYSRVMQGVLEMSNVQAAEEMVNLIIAQRAYDLNSKAITTSDDMLQTANNLKRG